MSISTCCPHAGGAGAAPPAPPAAEASTRAVSESSGPDAEVRRRIVQSRKLDEPLYYQDYLGLGKVLSAQHPKSGEFGPPAHDEHLFIIIHQVYELWFKQILHELDSVRAIFSHEYVAESNVDLAVHRLRRVTEIQRILVQQLTVLETMTPLEFLDFRDVLFPASGFQSVQFRLVENKLGLSRDARLTYGTRCYTSYLREGDAALVKQSEEEPSLLRLIEQWLERTPLLKMDVFDFWNQYQAAVIAWMDEDRRSIRASSLPDEAKAGQLKEIDEMWASFETMFSEEKYNDLLKRGDRHMSYKASKAALLIMLFQDQPILYMPHQLLTVCLDVDEHFTQWRHRHALMVHRMLGTKMGTGGSSGYQYLRASANKHKVFDDLFGLSTFLIPRHARPILPPDVLDALGFTAEARHRATSSGGAAGGGGGTH